MQFGMTGLLELVRDLIGATGGCFPNNGALVAAGF